jgi:aspartyl-tRNA(Asn)/glutamyl-tRNA(Gln) amidotransferase subunit A
MHTEIAMMPATELVERFRDASVSPVEATRAALDRIDKLDRHVNAFVMIDGERAMDDARASEGRWRRAVPTSVKDLMPTRGWPTLRGSRTTDPAGPWIEDAPCVARLREHGAILIGKTTTPEFGWKGVTDSPLSGITRNPWSLDCTPGGSSGGSAVAVALGMGTLATGSDGGGSIRIPAGFTGIFGIKPSYGRVPLYPPSPFGALSHAGPMTRTVADAALMLNVMAEPDGRDAFALPYDSRDWRDSLNSGVKGLRIGFSPTLGYAKVDTDVAARVAEAITVLADLGAEVEEIDPGFGNALPAFQTLWFAAAAYVVGALTKAQRALLDPGLAAVAEKGATIPTHDYFDAVAYRADLGVRMGRFHDSFDLLATPSIAVPAFAVGREAPRPETPGSWPDWTPFTYPFNMTGQPAASIPCGFTSEGLPVGLQLVGRRHDDGTVLAAAQRYEQARPFIMPQWD